MRTLVFRLFVSVAIIMMATDTYAQLPSISLKTIDGKTVDTGSLGNNGKPFVISFFATWCKPCNRELRAISEVYSDWQEETGMRLIAVSIDQGQNINKVKPMVDAEEWEYEILLDPNGDFRRALGIQLIPHVLIIDGNGKIIESRSGYAEGAESHIIEKIRELRKNE